MSKESNKKKVPGEAYIKQAKNYVAGMGDTQRAYAALAVGLFFFLFGIGYFNVLRVGIGILGATMIIWGTMRSGLIATINSWLDALLKRS